MVNNSFVFHLENMCIDVCIYINQVHLISPTSVTCLNTPELQDTLLSPCHEAVINFNFFFCQNPSAIMTHQQIFTHFLCLELTQKQVSCFQAYLGNDIICLCLTTICYCRKPIFYVLKIILMLMGTNSMSWWKLNPVCTAATKKIEKTKTS